MEENIIYHHKIVPLQVELFFQWDLSFLIYDSIFQILL